MSQKLKVMPATITRPKTAKKKPAVSQGLKRVATLKKVTTKKGKDLESFKELIAQCQKIGSELYDKGLIKPYDPIR